MPSIVKRWLVTEHPPVPFAKSLFVEAQVEASNETKDELSEEFKDDITDEAPLNASIELSELDDMSRLLHQQMNEVENKRKASLPPQNYGKQCITEHTARKKIST